MHNSLLIHKLKKKATTTKTATSGSARSGSTTSRVKASKKKFPKSNESRCRDASLLYHTEIGFPSSVVLPSGVFSLTYSRHAQNASSDDRYGQMVLPDTLNVDVAKLIEIEVRDGEVIKGVYRINYDSDLDLIIVLIPHTSFVKTVWFNEVNDVHSTLQAWKYTTP